MKPRRHERYAGGVIRKLPNGRVQAERTVNYETRRQNFATRDEAARWLETEQIAALNRSTPLNVRQALDYNDALKVLPQGVTLLDAARFYTAHHATIGALTGASIGTVYEKFMADKKEANCRPRTLARWRSEIGRLADAHKNRPLHEITSDELRAFLKRGTYAPVTRDSIRASWIGFWRYAIKNGAAHTNAPEAIARSNYDEPAPEIFTPEQTRAFLAAVREQRPDLHGWFAIAFYAGLRTTELMGIQWDDIHDGHITVRPAIAKRRRQRLVPVLPVLAAHLNTCRRVVDRVAPIEMRALITARDRLIHPIDFTTGKSLPQTLPIAAWPNNVARHSFISYRLAVLQSADQVALEAGNSSSMVFRHYRQLVTPAQAADYFAIPNR